ncbi:hypothetical protein BLNAU_22732 [Blattamonas nauphoetae]|uniref:Uncharacterized protein n=1 Tax=Blattamonas nauphoetae TaxID=2049346 RepID=A0ABQ9WS86_9EUKA|nr:hypothetical protein BLNAU_22732 [Blattamonas nauphoetae]
MSVHQNADAHIRPEHNQLTVFGARTPKRNQHDSDDLSQLTPIQRRCLKQGFFETTQVLFVDHRRHSLHHNQPRHVKTQKHCSSTSFGNGVTLVAVGMTDSSGNSAFTRSITNTEGTELTKCTTMDETVKESKLLPLENSSLRDGTSTAPTQQHLACVTSDNEKEALTTSASVNVGGKYFAYNTPEQVFKGDIADHITPARLSRIGQSRSLSEGRNDYPIDLLGILTHFKLVFKTDSLTNESSSSLSYTLSFTTVNLGTQVSSVQTVYLQTSSLPSFGTEDNVHIFDLRFIQYQKIEQFIRSRHFVQIQRICGRPHYQTHRTLQERRIANSSTKPGSLSASLSLVEGLLQKDGQKYNQTGFKVRGERVEDMLAEDTLTVAVTTEPALVCDLSFEVDTGTQKTWKSWN